MSVLSKAEILNRRVGSQPVELQVAEGESVLVLPVGSRLLREYRAALRDEDGKPIEERKQYVDELLVARVLVDDAGNRLFSDDEVLAGALDNMQPLLWDALTEHCWGFLTGGNRQKKS